MNTEPTQQPPNVVLRVRELLPVINVKGLADLAGVKISVLYGRIKNGTSLPEDQAFRIRFVLKSFGIDA